MGKTSIEWTNLTWNPWRGCHKVSAGCKNCYMFREQKRWKKDPTKVVRAASKTFNSPLNWLSSAFVFTCSWSDWFIEEADEWRDDAWEIIRQTPHLTYQILTKRIENVPDRLPDDWGEGYDNVWLGVSIESQEYIHRAFHLNKVPAKIRFVSAEPLLSGLYLKPHLSQLHEITYSRNIGADYQHGIDWVIVGGESGPNCRPMDLRWAASIAEQCRQTAAKFFMKQASNFRPGAQGNIPNDLWSIKEYPSGHDRRKNNGYQSRIIIINTRSNTQPYPNQFK